VAKAKSKCNLMCCTLTVAAAANVTATIGDWVAGGWAESVSYGPACHCGLRTAKEVCPRHGEEDGDRPG
jgi:hypothetical protein